MVANAWEATRKHLKCHHQFQPTKRATASGVRSICLDSNLVSASVTLLRQLHNRDMFGASHQANWSQKESRILELSESIS